MYGWDWGPHGVPVGLWKPVRLRVSGPLRIDHPYVVSRINTAAEAVCTVAVDVRNLSSVQRNGSVRGLIEEKESGKGAGEFAGEFTLAPGEIRRLTFDITVKNPRLWWPNGMGAQSLYALRETVSAGGAVSEESSVLFGIRELKLVENENIA